jgi:hypothetical protein
MANPQQNKPDRDWYTIPVSSLVRGGTLLGLVVALVVGILIFQRWEHHSLRGRAEAAIAEGAALERQLQLRDDYEQVRREHYSAFQELDTAKAELEAEHYRSALDRADRGVDQLQRILNVQQGPNQGRSRFVDVQGGVEYRRGERGAWKRARPNDTLNPGDWVKTSGDGTAEIRFDDGSKYVLRRDTMVRLGSDRNELTGGEEQVTDVVFGWVELNTTQSGSRVTTPKSEAQVRRDSEALVSFDREEDSGKFASYRGTMEVKAESGQTREVRELQQVDQVGDLLSQPKALPAQVQLLRPSNDQQIALEEEETQLAWQPVSGARQYSLAISRSPLFADQVISDPDRRKTTARLGLQDEGIFFWRVAAVDRSGNQGPWSEPRAFRVAAVGATEEAEDTTPPVLLIQEVQTYGSLVLVSGKTEPGATVTINEEPVSVQLDGSFSKTIQMTQAGFAFVEIVAVDAWDNPTEMKRRVFIDAL